MKFIKDFILNWIECRDIKEAWQDARFMNSKKWQAKMKESTDKLDNNICPHCKEPQKGWGDCADTRCYEC